MIDLSRSFATSHPTDEWGGKYKQDGVVYNSQKEYLPDHPDNAKNTKPKPQVAKVIASVKIEEDAAATKTPAQVIEMVEHVKFYAFKKEAKKILGDTCPRAKKEILEALERKLPKKPVAEDRSEVLTWDSISPAQVNLTAWAQGDKDYIFPEVMSAIQGRFHKSVTNITDAVDFLIDEGVVEAKDARTN